MELGEPENVAALTQNTNYQGVGVFETLPCARTQGLNYSKFKYSDPLIPEFHSRPSFL